MTHTHSHSHIHVKKWLVGLSELKTSKILIRNFRKLENFTSHHITSHTATQFFPDDSAEKEMLKIDVRS